MLVQLGEAAISFLSVSFTPPTPALKCHGFTSVGDIAVSGKLVGNINNSWIDLVEAMSSLDWRSGLCCLTPS